MTDGDERRKPATGERCRRELGENVDVGVLDQNVVVILGPMTVGSERRGPTTFERYRGVLGENVGVGWAAFSTF